jgi:hypothetical protein
MAMVYGKLGVASRLYERELEEFGAREPVLFMYIPYNMMPFRPFLRIPCLPAPL